MLVSVISQYYYSFLHSFGASNTKRILVEAIDLLGELWIYLVLGIVVSTAIKSFVSKQRMANFFRHKRSSTSIAIASIVGVVSPLGSYIIIPMSAALFGMGVPLSVLMALIVATPLISPNIFVLTAGAMGMELAILRVVSAFVLGCVAGYATLWMEKKQLLYTGNVIKDDKQFSLDKFSQPSGKSVAYEFFIELYKMSRYVSKFFFLAILLAAVLKIAVNPKIIIRLFDSDNLLSIILSTAAGIPFYVCGGAAIPVVQQLADLGMSKGAVLAYFISGPVTKISNLVILQGIFKRNILIQYLIVGIGGAMAIGFIYNLL